MPATAAHAATTTFSTVADARVEQANPSTNYGTYKIVGRQSPAIRTYVKFDLTGLSGTVTSAKLRIYPNSASSAGYRVSGAGSSWTETGVTWDNAPVPGAAVGSSGGYACCTGYVGADVTPLVGGNGTVTVVVTSAGTTTDLYRSREYDATSGPKLDVTTSTTSTADTIAPSVPAGVSAKAGDGQATLSWSPSTDNVGVSGYRVYRDGVLVGSTASTSMTVSGLTNGTSYGLSVAAYDAAGNASAQSAKVAVTPVAAPSTTTRYVSTSGSDANAGTQSAPWRTISKAAAAAPAGSTVIIMGGSYAEDVTFSTGGASGSPTTFQRNGTDTVIVRSLSLKASHVAVRGLTVSGAGGNCVTIAPALSDLEISGGAIRSCGSNGIGFTRPSTQAYTRDVRIVGNTISGVGTSNTGANDLTVYGDYVTVQDNDLSGSQNDAIDLWGDHQIYRHNRIHDISNTLGHHNDAFQTWTGLNDGAEGHPVTNLLVERNRVVNITGSDAHCFMAEGPSHTGWTIRDNVFANIGNQCMILGKKGNGTQGIQRVVLGGNTFVSAGSVNTIEFNLTTTGTLAGNIFFNCRGWSGNPPYYVASTASVTRDYNLAGGTSPKVNEAHGINADPRFVNAAGGDYHLASGSPAINAGDDGALISPVRSVDLDGLSTVGRVDIGAYEAR